MGGARGVDLGDMHPPRRPRATTPTPRRNGLLAAIFFLLLSFIFDSLASENAASWEWEESLSNISFLARFTCPIDGNLNGNNLAASALGLHSLPHTYIPGVTVAECAALCWDVPQCVSFDFGQRDSSLSRCYLGSARAGVGGSLAPPGQHYRYYERENITATADPDQCVAVLFGCTNPGAINYQPAATVDDGGCDVDPCRLDNPCHTNATCVHTANVSGSFECSCTFGHAGDGVDACTYMRAALIEFHCPLSGSLRGNNLVSTPFRGLSEEQCAGLCSVTAGCVSFDYGVTRGEIRCYLGSGVLGPGGALQSGSYVYYEKAVDLCGCGCVRGCMDSTAFNFNSTANHPDGSCQPIVYGCTHLMAPNRDSLANTDDGTCAIDLCARGEHDCDEHATCVSVPPGQYRCECSLGYTGSGQSCVRTSMALERFACPMQGALTGNNLLPSPYYNGGLTSEECAQFCLNTSGCVSFDYGTTRGTPRCYLGNGIAGQDGELSLSSVTYTYYEKAADGCGCLCMLGCTDPEAINYNPAASMLDGSCVSVVQGCMEPMAVNFQQSANRDDGSCVMSVCVTGEHSCHLNNATCAHLGPGLHSCACVDGFVGDGVNCEVQIADIIVHIAGAAVMSGSISRGSFEEMLAALTEINVEAGDEAQVTGFSQTFFSHAVVPGPVFATRTRHTIAGGIAAVLGLDSSAVSVVGVEQVPSHSPGGRRLQELPSSSASASASGSWDSQNSGSGSDSSSDSSFGSDSSSWGDGSGSESASGSSSMSASPSFDMSESSSWSVGSDSEEAMDDESSSGGGSESDSEFSRSSESESDSGSLSSSGSTSASWSSRPEPPSSSAVPFHSSESGSLIGSLSGSGSGSGFGSASGSWSAGSREGSEGGDTPGGNASDGRNSSQNMSNGSTWPEGNGELGGAVNMSNVSNASDIGGGHNASGLGVSVNMSNASNASDLRSNSSLLLSNCSFQANTICCNYPDDCSVTCLMCGEGGVSQTDGLCAACEPVPEPEPLTLTEPAPVPEPPVPEPVPMPIFEEAWGTPSVAPTPAPLAPEPEPEEETEEEIFEEEPDMRLNCSVQATHDEVVSRVDSSALAMQLGVSIYEIIQFGIEEVVTVVNFTIRVNTELPLLRAQQDPAIAEETPAVAYVRAALGNSSAMMRFVLQSQSASGAPITQLFSTALSLTLEFPPEPEPQPEPEPEPPQPQPQTEPEPEPEPEPESELMSEPESGPVQTDNATANLTSDCNTPSSECTSTVTVQARTSISGAITEEQTVRMLENELASSLASSAGSSSNTSGASIVPVVSITHFEQLVGAALTISRPAAAFDASTELGRTGRAQLQQAIANASGVAPDRVAIVSVSGGRRLQAGEAAGGSTVVEYTLLVSSSDPVDQLADAGFAAAVGASISSSDGPLADFDSALVLEESSAPAVLRTTVEYTIELTLVAAGSAGSNAGAPAAGEEDLEAVLPTETELANLAAGAVTADAISAVGGSLFQGGEGGANSSSAADAPLIVSEIVGTSSSTRSTLPQLPPPPPPEPQPEPSPEPEDTPAPPPADDGEDDTHRNDSNDSTVTVMVAVCLFSLVVVMLVVLYEVRARKQEAKKVARQSGGPRARDGFAPAPDVAHLSGITVQNGLTGQHPQGLLRHSAQAFTPRASETIPPRDHPGSLGSYPHQRGPMRSSSLNFAGVEFHPELKSTGEKVEL